MGRWDGDRGQAASGWARDGAESCTPIPGFLAKQKVRWPSFAAPLHQATPLQPEFPSAPTRIAEDATDRTPV